jgi:hypothetical protein
LAVSSPILLLHGAWHASWCWERVAPLLTARGAVRIDGASADEQYRATARECFHGAVPDQVATAAGAILTPDAPARLHSDTVPITAERWGSVPRTWVRCTGDRAVPIAAQDANIAALDALAPAHPFRQETLDIDHSPMFSAPDLLADVLLRVAG